jgi:hypothetical protein
MAKRTIKAFEADIVLSKATAKYLTFMFFELFPILPYRVTVSSNEMLLRLNYEAQRVSYSRRLR